MKLYVKSSTTAVQRRIEEVNQMTDPVLLKEAALDPSPSVRAEVARNVNTPTETLSMLAQDRAYLVRAAIGLRTGLSEDLYMKVASYRGSYPIGLINNPSVSDNVLMYLATERRDKDAAAKLGISAPDDNYYNVTEYLNVHSRDPEFSETIIYHTKSYDKALSTAKRLANKNANSRYDLGYAIAIIYPPENPRRDPDGWYFGDTVWSSWE